MKTLATAALLLTTIASASAGCHISFGDIWCDPHFIAPPISYAPPPPPPRMMAPPPVIIPPPPPVPLPPNRPIVTRDHLAMSCSSPDKLRQAGCAGFVSGVADSYAWQGTYCLGPDNFEVERSVINYIRRVPMQGLTATQMVLEALRAQWPCR